MKKKFFFLTMGEKKRREVGGGGGGELPVCFTEVEDLVDTIYQKTFFPFQLLYQDP